MTPEFSADFHARLEKLVSDHRSFHKPTRTRIAPRVYKTMLPDMDEFVVGQKAADKEGDAFPCVCWGIAGGEISIKTHRPLDVNVICAIAIDDKEGTNLEQIQRGSAEIESLTLAVGGLVNSCFFKGYKMLRPIAFTLGLSGDGEIGRRQPHPIYVVQFKLSFLAR